MEYKKLMLILLVILLMPTFAFSDKKHYGDIKVYKVWSNYDGDSIKVSIKGYPAIIGDKITIRVANIDTPEMRDNRPKIKKLAEKAKQFAATRLNNGLKIELRNIRRGKYFRIVAEVWIDGKNLGRELINAGLAKSYDGGKKTKWK